MPPVISLEDGCVPRSSVFEQRGNDTVYSIDDLDQIDSAQFFGENYLTEGMQLLLSEAFKRLEGRSQNTAGTFLLSQSMGGGKTHNLLALGLLAKYPHWREEVMSGFYTSGPLGAVRVVTFSGRKTNTPFGIWGEIAEQLNNKDAFKDFYSPLKPPGDDDWIELLRGEPKLLLLDELPPYFEAARAVAVGNTFLDTITTTALSNLLVAVSSGKLPNVTVVLTDLSGTAYNLGSSAVTAALTNLEREVNRSVVRIDPVRINTNELYHILRTRLFERLPSDDEIDAVAEAYRQEVERAKLMDITAASPEQLKAEIRTAYPFHPAIRDLYARFKENSGFQQTRALIRIMRLIVADLWDSGAARSKHLIGAHDLDLHQQDVMSEVRQINPSMEAAIAHDIAAEGGGSVAEQIDRGQSSDAQDTARLIFLSSLSQAVNPTLGLERSEIVRYLAAPGRDVVGLNAAIDALQAGAWYIHPTRDGRLLFKDIENLVAKLDTYTRGKLREQREGELRDRLREMFKPTLHVCYQQLAPLPPLDEVQLGPDVITLVVFRPAADALDEIKRFHEYQQYKNRALFLTGNAAAYDTVLQRAAELSAIRAIIGELRAEGRGEADPQIVEAEGIKTKKEAAFYQACRETFQTLYYPYGNGLTPFELEPRYVANEYKGEDQVLNALREAYKFREDVGPDSTFRNTVENKLWPEGAKETPWADVKRRAATDPAWVLHHPRALDTLKDELVRRDIWREHGNFVERGPFPQPRTSVSVQQLTRDDTTGEVTLRVRPLHGDTVCVSEDGRATTASKQLERYDFPTAALRLSFVAIDSSGEHETGDPAAWTNTITIKHRFFQDGSRRRCELRAVPTGTLRYTTDGSGPDAHGAAYLEPFIVPDDCRVVQVIAQADGIRSEVTRIDAPIAGTTAGDGDGSRDGELVQVDEGKPATWKHEHRGDDTNATYTWLELAAKRRAALGGITLIVAHDERWVELRTSDEVLQSAQDAIDAANRLKDIIPNGNLDLGVKVLSFESGRDLLDMVRDLHTELRPGEVIQ